MGGTVVWTRFLDCINRRRDEHKRSSRCFLLASIFNVILSSVHVCDMCANAGAWCEYMHTYKCGYKHMWGSEDNCQGSILSFYPWYPGTKLRSSGLCSKCVSQWAASVTPSLLPNCTTTQAAASRSGCPGFSAVTNGTSNREVKQSLPFSVYFCQGVLS